MSHDSQYQYYGGPYETAHPLVHASSQTSSTIVPAGISVEDEHRMRLPPLNSLYSGGQLGLGLGPSQHLHQQSAQQPSQAGPARRRSPQPNFPGEPRTSLSARYQASGRGNSLSFPGARPHSPTVYSYTSRAGDAPLLCHSLPSPHSPTWQLPVTPATASLPPAGSIHATFPPLAPHLSLPSAPLPWNRTPADTQTYYPQAVVGPELAETSYHSSFRDLPPDHPDILPRSAPSHLESWPPRPFRTPSLPILTAPLLKASSVDCLPRESDLSGRNGQSSKEKDPSLGLSDTRERLKKSYRRKQPPAQCAACGATDTPEWRKGPSGSRTLCNACGLQAQKMFKGSPGTEAEMNEQLRVLGEARRMRVKLSRSSTGSTESTSPTMTDFVSSPLPHPLALPMPPTPSPSTLSSDTDYLTPDPAAAEADAATGLSNLSVATFGSVSNAPSPHGATPLAPSGLVAPEHASLHMPSFASYSFHDHRDP